VAVGASAGVAAGASAGVAAGTAAGRGAAAEAAGSAADPAAAGTATRTRRGLRPDAPPPGGRDGEASGGSRRVVGGVPAGFGPDQERGPSADGASAGPRRSTCRRGTARTGSGGRTDQADSASAPAHGLVPRCRAPSGTVPGGHGAAARAASFRGPLVGPPIGPPRPPPCRPGPRRQSQSGAAEPRRRSVVPAPRPSSSGSTPIGSGGSSLRRSTVGSRRRSYGAVDRRGPAWPASGWPSAGPRQRSSGRARPNPARPAARGAGGLRAARGPSGQDEPPATPFWLRPIRRDK
jgi:hypothetical protein